MVSLNFSLELSFHRICVQVFRTWHTQSSFKIWQTMYHWKLFSNHFWLVVGQMNELQQHSFKSILNISRYICCHLDKKVTENSNLSPHKFSCDGGTIQNLSTNCRKVKTHEFFEYGEMLSESPLRWHEAYW